MTDANKVLAFLDLSSGSDPSLGVVMAAALAVYGAANQLARRRTAPLFAPAFALPTRRDINLRLLGGAALFGAGWGLGGYCPGPAITSLLSLAPAALLFVSTLSVGGVGGGGSPRSRVRSAQGPRGDPPRRALISAREAGRVDVVPWLPTERPPACLRRMPGPSCWQVLAISGGASPGRGG